jgi:hypothetical protein
MVIYMDLYRVHGCRSSSDNSGAVHPAAGRCESLKVQLGEGGRITESQASRIKTEKYRQNSAGEEKPRRSRVQEDLVA